jgi:hypothetical protein
VQGLWGDWAFAVNSTSKGNNQLTINFAYGGYQEARGSGINNGQHFYIENIFEELDVPGEWYYDYTSQTIYFYPNGTDPRTAEVAVPISASIVSIIGNPATSSYAVGITFANMTFTQSRYTFMEQYEVCLITSQLACDRLRQVQVPSGGDWSIHRGAAFFVQDAESINVVGCTFTQVRPMGTVLTCCQAILRCRRAVTESCSPTT